MLLIPNALCWSSRKCNCACALPAEVQLRLRVTRRSWQKLIAGKNFVKILVTAQTQLRSYSEQQRAFGNSNICNWRGIQIILFSSIFGMRRNRYENFATKLWKGVGKGHLFKRVIVAGTLEWRGTLQLFFVFVFVFLFCFVCLFVCLFFWCMCVSNQTIWVAHPILHMWISPPPRPSCRGTQIILISSIEGMHRYENFATKK